MEPLLVRTPAGALESAWLRLADGAWLVVEPGAGVDGPWGRSDRIARSPARDSAERTPLASFESLDWARIDRIPTLADPARLPPGAGTAVLNLIAWLARTQGVRRLAYPGPYPTERLFTALLESFRYVGADADPLAAFMAGALEWEPAPHERLFPRSDLYVQRRGRIERVAFRGVAYHRPDWQGVARHAPRRVRDTPAGVVCSLWALGRPLEDHLLLSPEGALLRVLEPAPVAGPARAMAPALVAGVAAAVAAMSAPALAPYLRAAVAAARLEWGAVDRELVAVAPAGLRVSLRLHEAFIAGAAAAPGRGARAALALATLTELAALLGDILRARAQAALAASDGDTQRAALAAGETAAPASEAGAAREIAGAVEALLEELAA